MKLLAGSNKCPVCDSKSLLVINDRKTIEIQCLACSRIVAEVKNGFVLYKTKYRKME